MKLFILHYFGGEHPSSPEAAKQHFSEYQQWLTELGDTAVKPMVPHKNSHTITAPATVTAGSSTALSGHTIIQALTIEAAIEVAKSCPFLALNGQLEIAEIGEA